MNALEVKNLRKVYPSFTLQNVSFSVEEGRVTGLVGANGAGKSTTLKGILGLIETEGEARVFSYEAKSLRANRSSAMRAGASAIIRIKRSERSPAS